MEAGQLQQSLSFSCGSLGESGVSGSMCDPRKIAVDAGMNGAASGLRTCCGLSPNVRFISVWPTGIVVAAVSSRSFVATCHAIKQTIVWDSPPSAGTSTSISQ